MLEVHKKKYHPLYWDIAEVTANQSMATRKKVGSCLVTSNGMIAIGYNGMPSGFDNTCEEYVDGKLTTKKEVVHAERNTLDKLTLEGVSSRGAIIFITLAPCLECAKSLYNAGVVAVYYKEDYRCSDGVDFLKHSGIYVAKKGEY